MTATPWLVWVVVAALAWAGEVFTLGLYLGSFGVAAALAAIASFVAPVWLQVVLFVAVSAILLFAGRPAVLRLLPHSEESSRSPRIGPLGKGAVVTQRLGRQTGQIRVGEGEFWSARPLEDDAVLLPGQEVEVIQMDGLTALVRGILQSPAAGQQSYGLSARELEVLGLMARGLSNQEIADQLFLSPRTVHHHVSHILTKMDAPSRMAAVTLDLRQGLLKPGE